MPRPRDGNPLTRTRGFLDHSTGARVIVWREDLEYLMAAAVAEPPQAAAPSNSITLTVSDVELVAASAWDSSPDRVAEHGPWDSLPDDDYRRDTTLDAARRMLHHLFTGQTLPAAPAPAPH